MPLLECAPTSETARSGFRAWLGASREPHCPLPISAPDGRASVPARIVPGVRTTRIHPTVTRAGRLVLAVAILGGLAACSSDEASAPTTDSTVDSTSAPTTEATSPDATDPDSTTDRQLTDEPGLTFQSLDVSPDGSTIAFESDDGVGLLALESGDITSVVENDDTITASSPTYLGDGRLAVLISGPGEVGGTINIVGDGGQLQPVQLDNTVLDIEGGAGDTIVFVDLNEQERSLQSVQVDATAPSPVAIAEGFNDHDPSVSPDGTQLAFVRTDTDDAGNEVNTLMVTAVAGGIELPIIAGAQGAAIRAPAWAPDGSRLVVTMATTTADGSTVEQVYVVDPAVGTIQVTDSEGDKPEAVWISDGELAYRLLTTGDLDGQLFAVGVPAAG